MNFGELFFSIYITFLEKFRWILGVLVFTLVPVWVLFHPGHSLESQAFCLSIPRDSWVDERAVRKGWRKHSLMHSLLIIGHPLATPVVLQCKKSWDLPCMEGGRMSHSFIHYFPLLIRPTPSSSIPWAPLVLSCPALPIIRLKTSHQLIIISFDLHPHQLCSDLNHEEQQGGAMKGEEEHWDNTHHPTWCRHHPACTSQ